MGPAVFVPLAPQLAAVNSIFLLDFYQIRQQGQVSEPDVYTTGYIDFLDVSGVAFVVSAPRLFIAVDRPSF